ncbi:MAG: hypothetical protein WD360_07295 [Nitriliruptoraceae bacterium]
MFDVPAVMSSFVIANHGIHAPSGGGNFAVLFVFLGVLATAGWLIFSELRWAQTVTITVAGWVAGLAVMFVL